MSLAHFAGEACRPLGSSYDWWSKNRSEEWQRSAVAWRSKFRPLASLCHWGSRGKPGDARGGGLRCGSASCSRLGSQPARHGAQLQPVASESRAPPHAPGARHRRGDPGWAAGGGDDACCADGAVPGRMRGAAGGALPTVPFCDVDRPDHSESFNRVLLALDQRPGRRGGIGPRVERAHEDTAIADRQRYERRRFGHRNAPLGRAAANRGDKGEEFQPELCCDARHGS